MVDAKHEWEVRGQGQSGIGVCYRTLSSGHDSCCVEIRTAEETLRRLDPLTFPHTTEGGITSGRKLGRRQDPSGYKGPRGIYLCILFDLYALHKSRVYMIVASASTKEIFRYKEASYFCPCWLARFPHPGLDENSVRGLKLCSIYGMVVLSLYAASAVRTLLCLPGYLVALE